MKYNLAIEKLDFNKNGDGLIPVIIQDAKTLKVLMLGFQNQEALEKTLTEGVVTFFSRTKQRLWTKGETSKNFLYVQDIKIDCDADTILIYANPVGVVCHTGADTCFDERNKSADFLKYLENIIHKRRKEPTPEGAKAAYTKSLFTKGINKIAQKVGEEAVELVIEAKDDNAELFLGEAADLIYHYLVLLAAKNFTLEDVLNVLRERHQSKI